MKSQAGGAPDANTTATQADLSKLRQLSSANLFDAALIGYPLGHSISAEIHRWLMRELNVEGDYQLMALDPEEFDSRISEVLSTKSGLNVTIPYKRRVMAHLRQLDASSLRSGIVNTVCRGIGYNTDTYGFGNCLSVRERSNVLVLGAGATAMTVLSVLSGLPTRRIFLFARRPGAAQRAVRAWRKRQTAWRAAEPDGGPEIIVLPELTADFCNQLNPDLIVNTTPAGMYPNLRDLPLAEDLLSACFSQRPEVFDCVYNPAPTRFLALARQAGCAAQDGLSMLFRQALAAQLIWQGRIRNLTDLMSRTDADDFLAAWTDQSQLPEARFMAEVKPHRLMSERMPIKSIIIGFMAAGKTTLARQLREQIDYSIDDLDERIERATGTTIPQIFRSWGEHTFRETEHEIFARWLDEPGSAILACGGGTLLQSGNTELLAKIPHRIIWLDLSPEVIRARLKQQVNPSAERPLADTRSLERLWRERQSVYQELSDIRLNGGLKTEVLAEQVIALWGLEPWRKN